MKTVKTNLDLEALELKLSQKRLKRKRAPKIKTSGKSVFDLRRLIAKEK